MVNEPVDRVGQGRLAQWKSAAFTPQRSLVRTQYRPRTAGEPAGCCNTPRALTEHGGRSTMSASDQPTCGKWMPRANAYCARGPGHPPPCATPEAMERQRKRAADRVLIYGRNVNLDVKARWRQVYKLRRYNLTQERFDQLLADQGNACGICRNRFKDGQRICIDHDHNCCPVEPGKETGCCGKCVRGLLCVRCNTWLGWA